MVRRRHYVKMYVLKITYLGIRFSAKQQHMWWVPEVCDDGKGFVDKVLLRLE